MAFEVRLSREMRLVDVTMIGVGAMIGAGIFVLTGIAAGVAGPALLLVFLLNGIVALLTAAAYVLLQELRRRAQGTVCATAQVSTLRERLLKLAVWVERSVRRLVLHLPQCAPWGDAWRRVAVAVGATPG